LNKQWRRRQWRFFFKWTSVIPQKLFKIRKNTSFYAELCVCVTVCLFIFMLLSCIQCCLPFHWANKVLINCCKLNFMTSYLVKGWKIYAHAWMLCWWAGSAPVCDPKTFYQCANLRLAKYVTTNEAATCNCPRQCRHLSYNHDISQAVLSNYVLESGRNMLQSDVTLDELRMDYCSLEVSSKAEVCFVSSCKQLDCVSKNAPTFASCKKG